MPHKPCEADSTRPVRRSSLPRLSSLASLQVFNPFSSRHSNNNLPSDSTCKHSMSASSPTRSTRYRNNNEQLFIDEEIGLSSPTAPHFSRPTAQAPTSTIRGRWLPRQSNRQQLFNEPNREVSKSSAFSNIPLPIKSKAEAPRPREQSARQKSQHKSRSSRIPFPLTTNRTHSVRVSKILCADAPISKRSGTEPFLERALGDVGKTEHKRPAKVFNENLRFSTIHALPSMSEEVGSPDLCASSPSLGAGVPTFVPIDRDRQAVGETAVGVDCVAITKHIDRPDAGAWSENNHYRRRCDGSPTLKASPYRQSVQRWNSQPVIGASMPSQLKVITGVQLGKVLSETQPITLRNPSWSSPQQVETNYMSSHLPSLGSFESLPIPPSKKTLGEVNAREPLEFWTGRLVALCDRYRNEENKHVLSFSDSADKQPDSSDSEKMHSTEAAVGRQRRALEELCVACTTEEAVSSLIAFQYHLSTVNGDHDLAKPLREVTSIATESGSVRVKASVTATMLGSGSARRKAFIDRLLGKSSTRAARTGNTGGGGSTSNRRLSWV
ncbi:hypothetical protein K431DRAFT_331576 [Polychaeton citri CBS 116435]|uniref:Uncharacterized protein n=1 Tax=Polychaeton citri CBS 116435 TaxID=1314669 RepID=A0A9P4QF55_9PEZI|nr:hypothetical protein K431DRAFT_331576 [Polychaeton citri CBS 116435]